jgi:hypothetical protein
LFVNKDRFPSVQVRFPTQARAKACAEVLNERWKDYEKLEKGALSDVLWWIVDTIRAHEGLTKADWESLYQQ